MVSKLLWLLKILSKFNYITKIMNKIIFLSTNKINSKNKIKYTHNNKNNKVWYQIKFINLIINIIHNKINNIINRINIIKIIFQYNNIQINHIHNNSIQINNIQYNNIKIKKTKNNTNSLMVRRKRIKN